MTRTNCCEPFPKRPNGLRQRIWWSSNLPRQPALAIPKSHLHKGNPRTKRTSRDQNLKRGGAKQFLFADGIWSTGVSDNHGPRESRGNLALASQIDPSAMVDHVLPDARRQVFPVQNAVASS